ncbi:hypothetical protein [Aureimonas psammosilenae]|uniref:hypothetical protein n=1 Tax=Aureimonas psammosilenae TaxID=2495496 RepID=UPI001260FE3C|nr:hypothetical protein [Aureimonas psammosilenae]
MRSGILAAVTVASVLCWGTAKAQVPDYVPLNGGREESSPRPDPVSPNAYPNVDGTPSTPSDVAVEPLDPAAGQPSTQQPRQLDPTAQAAPALSPPAPGSPAPTPSNLPPLDIDRVMDKVKTCWTAIPKVYGTPAQGGFARIRVKLTPDGALDGSPMIIDKPAGPIGAKFATSAADAINRCQPYKLPAERYAEWRQVEMRFDTIDPDNPPPAPPPPAQPTGPDAMPSSPPPGTPAPAQTQSTFDNYVPSVPAPGQ